MASDITRIHECLRFLSSQCDGAQEQDGHGFNKLDASFGKSLAEQDYISARQAMAALPLLKKYRKQLERGGLRLPDTIETPVKKVEVVTMEQDYEPEYTIPAPITEKSQPASQHVSAIDDLRNGGTLSRSLPGYQERGPQIEMATLVEQAINEKRHALLEAATGTGKSLGYLIPAIRTGKKVVVSTANKALQDQLYGKDVPFLQKHLQPFGAALVKGMGNYVCLDRLDKERNEGLSFYAPDTALPKVVEATTSHSWNGDFELLPFQVGNELKAKINGNPEECARRKCPLYSQCYYYKMRAEASSAQVIITNHSMLMLDVVSGGKLLPARDVVVVDEAHMLEGVATDAFTIELTSNRVYKLLALSKIRMYTEEKTQKDATKYADQLWEDLEAHMPEDRKVTRIALMDKIQPGLLLSSTFELLCNQLKIKRPGGMTDKEDGLYDRLIERTAKLAQDLHDVFSLDNAEYVYYLERATNRKSETISVFMVPLTVSGLLRDTLFTDNKCIVTSATLATPAKVGGQPSFEFYEQMTGLDDPEKIESILPLVFNYQDNALLYLPDDLPNPAYRDRYGKPTTESTRYENAISTKMLKLVKASQGRAFLLFSSKRMLDIVHESIGSTLRRDGFNVLVQNTGLTTNEMIRQFKSNEKAVLFGLRTFWEGVDVSGEALSLVVIDKLPFIPTDDPVTSAKMQYIEKLNGPKSSFNVYSLPMVVLQLKQGVGRLIRSDTDTGVMAILDARMTTAPYGKKILACLPPAKQVSSLVDVERFFAAPKPTIVVDAPVSAELTTPEESAVSVETPETIAQPSPLLTQFFEQAIQDASSRGYTVQAVIPEPTTESAFVAPVSVPESTPVVEKPACPYPTVTAKRKGPSGEARKAKEEMKGVAFNFRKSTADKLEIAAKLILEQYGDKLDKSAWIDGTIDPVLDALIAQLQNNKEIK